MKFKEYPKTYEDVYTNERALSVCRLEHISFDHELTATEYKGIMNNFLHESSTQMFDISIKYYWLQRRFFYFKKRKKRTNRNDQRTDAAYGMFLKYYVGHSQRFITSRSLHGNITTYFEDFFPDFDKDNPFLNPEKYKFPYKHITIEFLPIVYQMPERLELLDIAEKNKMSYIKFLDYVINYVYSCNEESEKDIFVYYHSKTFPPYVRYNLKNDKRI